MLIIEDSIDREMQASESRNHCVVATYLKDRCADVVAAAIYNQNLILEDVSATTLRDAYVTLAQAKSSAISMMAAQKLHHELSQRNIIWKQRS